jgi:hypothetical protein
MKSLWIVLIYTTIIFYCDSFGQETEKPFVFPHKTGDMFQYFCEDGPGWYDTIQVFTVFDTADENGIIYMKQKAYMLNPFRPSNFFIDRDSYFWIDTVNHTVYGWGIGTDSTLLFKLDGKIGDIWIDTLNNELVKVMDKWTQIVWGKEVSIMEFGHYAPGDLTDTTTWLDVFGIYVADGFGIVFRGAGWSINMMGAVINDTLYGDTTLVTSVKNKMAIPETIKLNQNYPNPFNPSTTISFEIKERSNISLIVYDVTGREVKRLIDNNEYEAGEHRITWDGTSESENRVSSGVYFYRLIAGEAVSTRSMILMK